MVNCNSESYDELAKIKIVIAKKTLLIAIYIKVQSQTQKLTFYLLSTQEIRCIFPTIARNSYHLAL
jgi:hypothetical protein